jgi:eukaryotic-like serine/threonine-protein kinase
LSSTLKTVDAGVGIGEIFLGKYRVDAILGHGGMGVVALCTHLQLNERVAIKMLRRDVLDDVDAVERFMREAQAAVKLKSEYVARVTDVGRSDTNVPYMVMEYLDGHDLGQLLHERGSLGLPWAIELTLQVCEALTEAHSIGIVHRDVKPSNLFVTWRPDGTAVIKVLDFGISKAPVVSTLQLTQTQSLLGTPAYMSPEQMRSPRGVDARTDLWSLGTVLYELLEGRRPFEAESFSEMCVKVAVDPPAAMTVAPPALQQVVLRCLEKAPEQRFSSMAELARHLVPFANDPHQAQVAVERMRRTLRRSQSIDWDPARTSMPIAIRELGSAERLVAMPAPGSSPAIQLRVSPPQPPEVVPAEPRLAAPWPAQAAPPELRSAVRPVARRRRGALLVITAMLGASGLGVTLSVIRARSPLPAPPRAAEVRPIPVADPPQIPVERAPIGSAAEAPAPAEPGRAVRDPRDRPAPRPRGSKPKVDRPGAGSATKPTARPPCNVFAEPHALDACPPPEPSDAESPR